mmetsp:Transcript_91266/g.144192  ORF Transcript_91266/g.144192 Transcript_91266/m.144192 type:complete len:225 (+) Transcript_91266:1373-2047(+)
MWQHRRMKQTKFTTPILMRVACDCIRQLIRRFILLYILRARNTNKQRTAYNTVSSRRVLLKPCQPCNRRSSSESSYVNKVKVPCVNIIKVNDSNANSKASKPNHVLPYRQAIYFNRISSKPSCTYPEKKEKAMSSNQNAGLTHAMPLKMTLFGSPRTCKGVITQSYATTSTQITSQTKRQRDVSGKKKQHDCESEASSTLCSISGGTRSQTAHSSGSQAARLAF